MDRNESAAALRLPEARHSHNREPPEIFREIGTSTGHSGIWIAWALSKTGGKLITIDIDERRHREARANFETAGVSKFIDARLGDAHAIVPALPGPFDFVFSDADKDWYKNYLVAVLPKLQAGGCYATHNVSSRRRMWGGDDYLDVSSRGARPGNDGRQPGRRAGDQL